MRSRLARLWSLVAANPAARRRAAATLWLQNVAIGCLVGANYLAHVPEGGEVRVWLFALPALVSTVALLTVVPGALLLLLAHGIKRPRLLGTLQAAAWSTFQLLLFVDTRIYNVFRYHVNGQVWNLVYTRGSEDSIHLGWQVWAAGTGGILLGFVIELLLWRRAVRRAALRRPRLHRLLQPAVVWCAVLIPVIFVDKAIYAQADLSRDREMLALTQLFPLYARIPTEGIANAVLGLEIEARPRFELGGRKLEYPLERPALDPEGARPNVLLLVLDCWRSDMIGPEITPEIHSFAERCRVYEDHLAGGTSTRFGLLSLLYGLPGTYWFPVLAQRRSPVLLDALLDAGYDFAVFSSATQSFPEMRRTAWVRVPQHVHDDWPGDVPWKRDLQAGAALADWLRSPERDERPFFAFLLLDAAHQPYSHPPGTTPFEPTAAEVDYLALAANQGPDPELLFKVFNRYRNALVHADSVAGVVLAAAAESGLLDETLVVITGDHGEEFREHGHFGHTSAFTEEQVRVPFLLSGPGIEPGVERRPTCHADLPATVLEALGADPARRHLWTAGDDLLAPDESRRRVVSGWNELGLWTEDAVVHIQLSPFEADIEVYDRTWRLVPDAPSVIAAEADAIESLAEACNRFLRDRRRPR